MKHGKCYTWYTLYIRYRHGVFDTFSLRPSVCIGAVLLLVRMTVAFRTTFVEALQRPTYGPSRVNILQVLC